MTIAPNKRLIGISVTVVLILLVPLIAMQFTNEVNWTTADFVIGGVLLLSTGLLIEMVIRKVKTKPYRMAVLAVILLSLVLVWAELAVGIFGTPFGGQ